MVKNNLKKLNKYEIRFIRGRIKFLNNGVDNGNLKPGQKDNMLVIIK